jgi:uncharacterized protein YjbJ (UPF0337 family)
MAVARLALRCDFRRGVIAWGFRAIEIEGGSMGTDDKIDNKVEELGGKAKEGVGRATGDEELQAQGEGDQAKSNLKQAGEKVKDAFKG